MCVDRDISLHPNGYFTYNILLALSVFTDYNPDLTTNYTFNSVTYTFAFIPYGF